MRVEFRQGIIRYPDSSGIQQFLQANGNFVDLIATDTIDITFAQRGSNYLLSETSNVIGAWGPFNTPSDYWLYWDIDKITGVRTFGFTELEPIYGMQKPSSAAEDQHWFDTVNKVMMVYRSGAFREYIRVFAAKFTSASLFEPLGSGVVNFPFAGSQVAVNVSNLSGYILFDDNSKPLIRSNKEFITAESQFFINGSASLATRLESNVVYVKSSQNIAHHHVVKLIDDNEVSLARYDDVEDSVLGMIVEDVVVNDSTSIIIQGKVVNTSWNFSPVGAKLWVKENGELSLTDPHVDDPILYPLSRVPVARVLASDTIIFEQGLGGVGQQGPAGITTIPLATNLDSGAVFLSIDADSATSPIVVGDNDPRMTDQRIPLPHNHIAENVTLTPTGTIVENTVQSAIEFLEENKLSIDGGIVNGDIQLNGPIAFSNSVVNRAFVDALSYNAGDISYTPFGNLTSIDVQNALDELEVNKLNLSGGNLTGFLSLHADPVLNDHAATKEYVDVNIPIDTSDDLRFFMGGIIIPNTLIGSVVITKTTTLPQNLTTSQAVARVPATVDQFFDIQINGVTVGDILFSSGTVNGVFTFNTTQVLNPSDVISVLSPISTDATLEDIAVSISGTVSL